MEICDDESIERLKRDIDFLIGEKKKEDSERIMQFIMLKINSYSHTAYDAESNKFYRGIVGHRLRNQYRKDVSRIVRKYLKEKLNEKEKI